MANQDSINDPLIRIDSRSLARRTGEILAVACIKDEYLRLPYFLQHHRDMGVDRFFIIDNGSTDGSRDYVLDQPDCHLLSCAGNFFKSNVTPPLWCNAVRNTYCEGHWCASLDADELLAYPHYEDLSLRQLCEYLDARGEEALETLMLDMYAATPIRQVSYERSQPFLKDFPYFDSELGYQRSSKEFFPSTLTFSRFRERAFWKGEHKRQQLPTITKVGLVKWRTGMNYGVSQHVLTGGQFSELRGVLLHFKFFPDFFQTNKKQISNNLSVVEAGLSERQIYMEAMRRNPDLTLMHDGSTYYENSKQLVELQWMKTTTEFENFVKHKTGQTKEFNKPKQLTESAGMK